MREERRNVRSSETRRDKGKCKEGEEKLMECATNIFKRTNSIRNLVLSVPSLGPLVVRVKVDWNAGKTLGRQEDKAMCIGLFF